MYLHDKRLRQATDRGVGRGHGGARTVPEKPEKPSQEVVAVDFDPEDAREYLKGVDYPANKVELATPPRATAPPTT
jgi:hypothetical protein